MDAAGAVDAQNAPTAPWKTAQHAVSHSAHTHHRLTVKRNEDPTSSTRSTHEIPDSPNRAESKSSYSRREFKSKNAISLKEVREALFWLRVAEVKRLGDRDLRHHLLKEANELVSIFVTVIRNLGDL